MLRAFNTSRREWLRFAALVGCASLTSSSVIYASEAPSGNGLELLPQDEGRRAPPVVTALAVEPQRGLLALGGDDHRIRIRGLESQQQLHLLVGHTDWVRSLAFSRSGRMLFSAGNDGKVLAWSERQPSAETLASHSRPFTSLAASTTADVLAASTWDGQVWLFSGDNWQDIQKLEGPGEDTLCLAFSPDGQFLAAAGRGRVMIWNASTSDLVADERPHRQRIRALAFSPDGKWLASAGDDRRVHLRSLGSEQSGTYLTLANCKVFALQFIGNDELIAGGSDGTLRRCQLKSGAVTTVCQAHRGTVCALAWRNEQLISSGFDAFVRQWSFQDRSALAEEDGSVRVGAKPNATKEN